MLQVGVISWTVSKMQVIDMRKHLAASLAIACTTMSAGWQSGFAQSPPTAEHDAVVWSNRDLSLRPGGFAWTPDTETTLRLPHIDTPADFSRGRSGQLLLCEPGQFGFADLGAAYALAGKEEQDRQPR